VVDTVVDGAEESNFAEVEFSRDNRLKQDKMPSLAIGHLRISELQFVGKACRENNHGQGARLRRRPLQEMVLRK
jgi:hypothetical protein